MRVFKQSPTLEKVIQHWEGELPKDEKGMVDFNDTEFPFNLQTFCLEMDQLLSLLVVDHKRKLFAKQTLIPALGFVWVVFEGEETAIKRNPVAWFKRLEDLNRFIFSPDKRNDANES